MNNNYLLGHTQEDVVCEKLAEVLGGGAEEGTEEGTDATMAAPGPRKARRSRRSFDRETDPTQARLVRLVKRSSRSSKLTDEGHAWMMLRALYQAYCIMARRRRERWVAPLSSRRKCSRGASFGSSLRKLDDHFLSAGHLQ